MGCGMESGSPGRTQHGSRARRAQPGLWVTSLPSTFNEGTKTRRWRSPRVRGERQASPRHLLRTRMRIVSPPGGKLLTNHRAHPELLPRVSAARLGREQSVPCPENVRLPRTTHVLRTCFCLVDTSRGVQLRALKTPVEARPLVTCSQLLSGKRLRLCLCERRTVIDYRCLSNFHVMCAWINNLISSNSGWSNPYIPD